MSDEANLPTPPEQEPAPPDAAPDEPTLPSGAAPAKPDEKPDPNKAPAPKKDRSVRRPLHGHARKLGIPAHVRAAVAHWLGVALVDVVSEQQVRDTVQMFVDAKPDADGKLPLEVHLARAKVPEKGDARHLHWQHAAVKAYNAWGARKLLTPDEYKKAHELMAKQAVVR